MIAQPLAQPQIQGSGVAKTEARTVADFTDVDVNTAIHLELAVGAATSLVVTADDNILPHIITEVAGGTLKIHIDASTSTRLGVKVKATTPALNAFQGSGATTTALAGVEADQFKLGLSGASTCTLTGKAKRLDLTLAGASRCILNGDADRLTLDCSGASRVNAAGFTARAVEATLAGASSAEVEATQELTAKAAGASALRYAGSPAQVRQEASGASTIAPK
jgi:hypothetical protein